MSVIGMTVTTLATGLATAVEKDERPEEGGFDLSAGMFGTAVSDWIREVAACMTGEMNYQEKRILQFAESQWGVRNIEQVALKACGECGEFAEAVTKIGEGRATYEDADEEVGDILIVLSQWAAKRGTTLEALRSKAFAKIKMRAEGITAQDIHGTMPPRQGH